MQVRTRFAPSPTGFLHVGAARTALFAWAYARRHQGKFILRIEDTDLARSNAESVQAILYGMEWLGLAWDEGPFYQMERMDRYKELIAQLLKEGKAYRCCCSKERLEDLRTKQLSAKQKPRYDGLCRDCNTQNKDQPFVVRFKNPKEGEVKFQDQVHGEIVIQNSEMDDLIIARSDGTPTYNFTVVVDDMDMKITHVIRGADHINNTPRQINLLEALGANIPVYAHVPMILGQDGKKLSKRHGAESVMQYRDYGYLPEAMLNHLARLGWAHQDQEIFSREEIIKYFALEHISKAPAIFNIDKLQWLNQHYMKAMDADRLGKLLQLHLEHLGLDLQQGPNPAAIVPLQAERCHTLAEMAEKSNYFYQDITEYDAKGAKYLESAIMPVLQQVMAEFKQLNVWQAAAIHTIIINIAEQNELKLGKVAQPIRVAVTGGVISPPIDKTLELIGKTRVLQRLEQAIASIK